MVGRRRILGGAAAVASVLLAGCGVGRRRLVAAVEEAVAEVEGVRDVALETGIGGTFERRMSGTVAVEAGDRAVGVEIYDEVMKALVTVIHEELDDSGGQSFRVGGVKAVLTDGEELTAMVLDPEMSMPNPRLDRVTAGSFYEKYGLG